MISWAKDNSFSVIDLGSDADTAAPALVAAGLSVGSADLKSWSAVISHDHAKRADAVAENEAYFAECAKYGVRNYFTVLLPEDPSKPRSENFAAALLGLNELAVALQKHQGRLVIEGWPGPGALACTPEGYRGVIAETPEEIGINFDPSHLVRMGIDPIRFVAEFANRVYHVHGKDTEIIGEALYEYGNEQPPTFGQGHGFGAMHWRYTIPGHGEVRFKSAFDILVANNYAGAVSIELEDENFNGTEAGEKAGLIAGGAFLASV
ncbi:MAG: sugar phosphate isomerase/epimerase family protein [Fimbriimonas sp.]